MMRLVLFAATALAGSASAAYMPLHSRQQSTPPILLVPASAWKALNTSVGGRLHSALPLAYPCFNNYNGSSKTPDLSQCATVEAEKTNTYYLAENFGGWEYSNWAQCQASSEGCILDSTQPVNSTTPVPGTCSQGSIPSYYINISTVADVQAGLKFAKNYSVPLVVKNSGHDYKGRSSAPYSLALWTYKVQPALTVARHFKPIGCTAPVGTVISYGAGQGFDGIYDFANSNNLTIAGGSSATVGAAGGWLTGGGHSVLSNTLGLGVDNAQQIKAVLPNGTYITANRCQNTDMFFALRGGGGNAFGVIMETSTLAHPVTRLQKAQFSFGPMNQSALLAFMNVLTQNANEWASQGWGGFILPSVSANRTSTISMVTSSLTLARAKTALQPLTSFLTEYGGESETSKIDTITSYYEFYESTSSGGTNNGNGIGTALSSRLVPSQYYSGVTNQSATAQVLATMLERTRNGDTYPYKPMLICLTTPSSYTLPETDQPGGVGAASVSPAWRTSPHHVIYTRAWDPADPTAGGAGSVAAAFQEVHDAMQPLRQMAPDGGAYQNEADTFEPDPIDAFWGQENYDRLLAIKQEIDPANVLTCHQCVGWESTDDRYSCYPSISSS